MKNGYNLVWFKEITSDEENEQIIKSVSYEIVEHLGESYTEDEVVKICEEKNLAFATLMVVEVADEKVIKCCEMVFTGEENGETEFWFDCCEWDFRVYASVAFDNDKLL